MASSRHARLADFRMGAVLDHERGRVASDVGDALSNTLDALTGAGATIVEGWPERVDPVRNADSFAFHVGMFLAYHEPDGRFAGLSELFLHERFRMEVREAWRRYFTDVDLFLCPTNFTTAFHHDTRPFEQRRIATSEGDRAYTDQTFWIAHASLAGLPCVVAPIGKTSSGLPVGIQIVGPLFEDDTPLTFAELLAEVAGGYERPPLVRQG